MPHRRIFPRIERCLAAHVPVASLISWPSHSSPSQFQFKNASLMLALWSCGRRFRVVQAQRQIHRALSRRLRGRWKTSSRNTIDQGFARLHQARARKRPSWSRIPFGARLLGATPSTHAAMSAVVRPGRHRGTEPATARIARAMYATARRQTIRAARLSLPQTDPAAAAIAWAWSLVT